MADSRRDYSRDTVPNGAERNTSPPEGKEFPFPHIPPANSSTLNETFSGDLKDRDGEPNRHKSRARSHSRSASSMSNLLLVATERLGQETNRANALDARCAEVLAHLRTIVEDRDQLRRNLAKVQEELGLYKLQLDVAQNEIFRAQKIVDGVDKARVEAEEQAAKDRTLARQLLSERAVWVAREEGRNEGYKEGLREGRRLAYDASRKRPSRTRARTSTEEYTDGGYQDDDEPETYEPSRHSSPSSRRHWSSPSRSVHSTLPPDGASYASTLPIHAMEQRDPSDGPSTQSNPPSSESHQQPPRPPSAPHPERSPTARSSRPLPRAPERLPEPIDIRPDRRTFRASSPSMSHRSVALPPDGFIPTTGADSVIALPPPHELSRPVSIVGDDRPHTRATQRTGTATPSRRRTMSNVSAVSTRMSQYDILHPPRTTAPEAATLSHQVAQEWRIANADPNAAEQRRGTSAQDFNGTENFSTRSSIPRSQTSRRTGPRRPREIVMPMPLSTTMHAIYARQPTSAPAAPEQQPIYAPSNGASSSTLYAPPSSVPALQEYFDTNHDIGPTRSRSAMAWLKTRFARRSFSSSSVPNIQIEPPSNPASNPSTEQTMDNVLLAPDDAEDPTLAQHLEPAVADAIAEISMQPVPVPPPEPYPLANPVQFAQGNGRGSSAGHVSELPRGFVPLSPISPILPDLHTVTPFPLSSPTPATAPPPAPTPSPQPPAYTPRDIYYTPLRPATAGGTRSPPRSEVGGGGSIRSNGRARGASVGSALLASPAPLNRPLSIFSEA